MTTSGETVRQQLFMSLGPHRQFEVPRRVPFYVSSLPFPSSCAHHRNALFQSGTLQRLSLYHLPHKLWHARKQLRVRSPCSAAIPVSSLSFQKPGSRCDQCSGSTQVQCKACRGVGRLTKSGYHARNPVNVAKIIGAQPKFTLIPQLFCASCAKYRRH